MSARILLVEDHPMVRTGVRLLLEQAGMLVCAETESRTQALAALPKARPDLLLVDLSLWDESGLDLIRVLPREVASPPVVVFSMYEDWLHVCEAMETGAKGYVTKREIANVLLEAIRIVLAGGTFLSPRAARAVTEGEFAIEFSGFLQFSAKEREIYRCLGQGVGVGDIAERFGISRKTVESFCDRMQVKLNLKGMKELRQLSMRHRSI